MRIRPLGSRVLLKEIEQEESTASGIVLPASAKEKTYMAEVLEVGPGDFSEGKEIKMLVAKGDRVLYSKYSGNEIKLNNQEYLLVRQDDIMAIIEEE